MNDCEVKIVANYLPQYHTIPQNDDWWGKGYTDWIAAKAAAPLYEGHVQPKKPLNGNYYSLDNLDSILWQAQLATRYGIYGFGIYHYWFNDDLHLLEKPAELMLHAKDIDIHFAFIWDNASWVRTWSAVECGNKWAPSYDLGSGAANDDGVLAKLEYGDMRSWEKHFNYLLPFFRDERYIRIDNCPILGVMRSDNDHETLLRMVDHWNRLALAEGFAGVRVMSADVFSVRAHRLSLDYQFRYSPLQRYSLRDWLRQRHIDRVRKKRKGIAFYDYDEEWAKILTSAQNAPETCLLSGFVAFDDTPRRGENARIVKGSTPEKFQRYLTELLRISRRQGKEYVFLSAWNEWGEGMYLEPDEERGEAYLEAVSNALRIANGS